MDACAPRIQSVLGAGNRSSQNSQLLERAGPACAAVPSKPCSHRFHKNGKSNRILRQMNVCKWTKCL